MSDKKEDCKLLNEGQVKEWISLVMKVNHGFELDDREINRLGQGFMAFDTTNVPEDIKNQIKKAQDYYKINVIKN